MAVNRALEVGQAAADGGAAAARGEPRLAAVGRRADARHGPSGAGRHPLAHLELRHRRGRRLPAQDHRAAGGRRRPRVRHGQRRRGFRLRRRHRQPHLATPTPRARTDRSTNVGGGIGWTAASSTPPPAAPRCWRWTPPPAPINWRVPLPAGARAAPTDRRRQAVRADHRQPAAGARLPRTAARSGRTRRRRSTPPCSACPPRPSRTASWWPASAAATCVAMRAATPAPSPGPTASPPRAAATH